MINPTFNLNPLWQTGEQKSTRAGFGTALLELGATYPDLVVVTADLAESTQVDTFAKAFPDRFFDVGVAEQNLMSLGGGLAATGLIPFVSSYAMFSPGRNWEQLRNTVCYSNLNVKVVATHAGLSVGPDGATHQALEDIALTRVIPNLTVLSPCDYAQAFQATKLAAQITGPVYLRLSRLKTPEITTSKTVLEGILPQVLRYGAKVTIVATGIMVAEALKAAEEIDGEVINVPTIKPLDIEPIRRSVEKTRKLIVVEEHQIAGGLGSAILEAFIQNGCPLPASKLIGVKDQFGQSGSAEELLQHYGLTWEHIIQAFQSLTP